MPESRTASSLVPTAIMYRPRIVRVSSRCPSTTSNERDQEGRRDSQARKRPGDPLDPRPDVLGLRVRDQVSRAPGHLEHAQRDDERGDRPEHRDQAVDQAAEPADAQGRRRRPARTASPNPPARSPAPSRPAPAPSRPRGRSRRSPARASCPPTTTVRSAIWLTMIRSVCPVQKCLLSRPKRSARPPSTISMPRTSARPESRDTVQRRPGRSQAIPGSGGDRVVGRRSSSRSLLAGPGIPRSPRRPRPAVAPRDHSPRSKSLDQPARREHGDPVAQQHQLLDLAGDHHDPLALAGQVVDQVVDRELGRDVDAPRRLVEQETSGSRKSQRPISTFCWLPPLSCPTGCS